MTRWMYVVGVVGAAVMCVLAVTRHAESTTTAGDKPPAAAVVVRAAPAMRVAAPAPHGGSIAPAQHDEEPEEHAAPEAPQTAEEIRDRIEQNFAADHSASRPELEREVKRGVMLALRASSSLRSVACRSSLCRVETVHPDIGAYREFAARAFFAYEAEIRQGPVFALPVDEPEPAAGKPVVAVAFVSRPGALLPLE